MRARPRSAGTRRSAPMANTDPVADNAAVIHEVREPGAPRPALCDVFPVGAITRGLGGESLAEIGEMVEAGVRMFSDDGRCVPTPRLLRNALDVRAGVRRRGDRRALRGRVPRRGRADARGAHLRARSGSPGSRAEAEEVVVARDLAIARLTGGRLHLCHLSSAGSVELRAPGQGRGVARDRRGHAAPPRVQRRGPRHLRHEPEDEPAAALRRGPRRAPSRRSPTGRSTRSRPTTRRTPWRRRRPSSTRRRPARSASRPRSRRS